MHNQAKKQRRGFTLVEVLIVVVILGILAATVLPQFTQSTDAAQESALIQSLQTLRSQIQLYRFQHNGEFPTDETKLMTETDVEGNPHSGTVAKFGPYIVGQFPPNPYNGKRDVEVKTGPLAAGDAEAADSAKKGWVYSSKTGEIRAAGPNSLLSRDGVTPVNEL